MKFSLSWLQRYLQTDCTAKQIGEKLTALGLEVDEISDDSALGPIFVLELTPDRVDCAGVYGIARDLAAAGCGTLAPLAFEPLAGNYKSPIGVQLAFSTETTTACPYFIGRHIRNVKNTESPEWLKALLQSAGLKPISALVDITNYFSIGLCRPLHVFDAAKITGDLTVRLAKDGEVLLGLDENEYPLDTSMTVIADDAGPQALGGVLGGLQSGCSLATTDVFLEVAYFDPVRTAFTGRATRIISDARYRFERGVDPAFLPAATELASALIVELCGGEVSEIVVAGQEPDWRKEIFFAPERVASLGGLTVEEAKQRTILQDLGCTVAAKHTPWTVIPPSWRPDIEGSADLVEEILRVVGYDAVPATPLFPDAPLSAKATLSIANSRLFSLHHLCAARGMLGTVTWSFMLDTHAGLFAEGTDQLYVINPISSDLNYLRPSIIPNLLLAAKRNADRAQHNACFFEVGPVFSFHAEITQETVASGLRSGVTHERHWLETPRSCDVYDVKADVCAAFQTMGIAESELELTSTAPGYYHPGAAGTYLLAGKPVAHFGELHPGVGKALDFPGTAAIFEIFLDRLPEQDLLPTARPALAARPLLPVERDFAFVVDASVPARDLTAAIMQSGRSEIITARVFDQYAGKGIADGKKSLAVVVELLPQEKAFTENELEAIAETILAAVREQVGGELR